MLLQKHTNINIFVENNNKLKIEMIVISHDYFADH